VSSDRRVLISTGKPALEAHGGPISFPRIAPSPADATTEAGPATGVEGSPSSAGWRPPGLALSRVRQIGFGALGLQLVGLMIWSQILYDRYSLTIDFAGGEQGWFGVAHGHLNPVINNWGNTTFLRNHGEIIMWLLAPLYWIWHSGVTLLWVQDAAAVMTAAVAFVWIIELVEQRSAPPRHVPLDASWWRSAPTAVVLASLGLMLLVVNPWVVWATSFDFHIQTLATCFAILTAYDLAHGQRRAWLWVVLTLSCGDVASTFVFGVGLSAVVAGRDTRRIGVWMMAMALALVAALTAVGANVGSGLSSYAAASASRTAQSTTQSGAQTIFTVARDMATRPLTYLSVVWHNALNIYANVAPAGVLGFGATWGFGVPVVVLLSNDLRPSAVTALYQFQNFPIYAFLTLGTVAVLSRLGPVLPRIGWTIAVVLVANAVIWTVVWLPKTAETWLKVPETTASTVASVAKKIAPSDVVVASNGISGPLAQRQTFVSLADTRSVRVTSRQVWFLIAPEVGIEVDPARLAMGQLGYLVDHLHGTLVADNAGLYAVKVTMPAGTTSLNLPTNCRVTPAWAAPSVAGHPYTSGPVAGWGMRADGQPGYLVYGDYVRERRGSYVAAVSMDSAGPVTVEVWDADRSLLLARREIPATGSTATVEVPFTALSQTARPSSAGAGIWRDQPVQPPPNDQVEIRVYTAGQSQAIVHSLQIVPARADGSASALAPAGAC
jgi:uncharacterized membrane protein